VELAVIGLALALFVGSCVLPPFWPRAADGGIDLCRQDDGQLGVQAKEFLEPHVGPCGPLLRGRSAEYVIETWIRWLF